MSDKNSHRNQVIATLSAISKPLYEEYSYQIACNLYQEDDWKNAKVVGITISRPPEVDTYQIIRKAWELGKQVAVPKCHPKEKRMSFHLLRAFSQLESVYFGLLEPIEELTEKISPADIELLIVPGLAYNTKGYRLGFGGGYYDRFLAEYNGRTLSLAFREQIVSPLTVEDHDLPVSKIITIDEVIHTK